MGGYGDGCRGMVCEGCRGVEGWCVRMCEGCVGCGERCLCVEGVRFCAVCEGVVVSVRVLKHGLSVHDTGVGFLVYLPTHTCHRLICTGRT